MEGTLRMKKPATRLTMLALALVMLLLPMCHAAAAPLREASSDANIDFRAGSIIINPDPIEDEVGFAGIEIHFGERTVPIRPEVYYADGRSDSVEGVDKQNPLAPLTDPVVGVLINDARASAAATPWSFSVNLTEYASTGNPSFRATLTLMDGEVLTNAHPSKVDTALTLENNGTIVVPTDGQNVPVLRATNALGKGSHGAKWTNDKIKLELGASNLPGGFDVITDVAYEATMTWSLSLT